MAPQPVTDTLLRAVHTMNGAFAMTEVTALTSITSPLEGFLKRSLAAQVVPDRAGVDVVSRVATAIRETIEVLERPGATLPDYSDLAADVVALRDAMPEAMAPLSPMAVTAPPLAHSL